MKDSPPTYDAYSYSSSPSAPRGSYTYAYDPSGAAATVNTTTTTTTTNGVTTGTYYYNNYDNPSTPLTETAAATPFSGATVADSDREVRMAFIRRVYLILCLQIGLTMGIGALFMYVESIKTWIQTNYWIVWVNFIPTIIILIVLSFVRRKYPINFILLMAFTLLEGYTLGVIVSFVDVETVLQAVIITFAVFVGLTLFTFQTKWDFSGLAPILVAALFGLMMMGITLIFFWSSVGYLIYCILGVIVFVGLILVDTHQIINRVSPEDYIIAAVELYLDVINLFLFILRLLQICKQ